ncbi:MAG: hypothetical protein EBZ07_00940 [Verrucomicrobia bacterium]|nr:hypothetical protein [Verrucomicrobiota bacterium]
MADGPNPRSKRERLRPRLYGVAIYLVAGILLLQVFFCLSVFVLRPYAKSKTPDAILQQERVRATDSLMSSIFRSLGQGKESAVEPRGETNVPAHP